MIISKKKLLDALELAQIYIEDGATITGLGILKELITTVRAKK